MHTQKLWKIAALSLLTSNAMALSLGDMHTLSRFGEPLRARINLPAAQPIELESMSVELADKDAFQDKAVERTATHDNMRFRVVKENDSAFIAVETGYPVNDLDFAFLLKVTTQTGTFMRRYNVLVGAPTNQSQSVVSQQTSHSGKNPLFIPSKAPTPIVEENIDTQSKPVVGGDNRQRRYGPVKKGQVLSIIAQQMRGDFKATLPQMMMAIYQQNPQAFENNNINELKKGSVLTLSDIQSVTKTAPRDAVAFVDSHASVWENRSGGSLLAEVKPAQETTSFLSIDEVTEDDLVTPVPKPTEVKGADIALAPGFGSPAEQLDLATLKQELQVTTDEAEALRQENENLLSKIIEFEKQVNQGTMALFNGYAAESIISKEKELYADEFAKAHNDEIIVEDSGFDFIGMFGAILVLMGVGAIAFLYFTRQRGVPEMELVMKPVLVAADSAGWRRWFGRRI